MKTVRVIVSVASMLVIANVGRTQDPSAREIQQKRDQLRAAVQAICPMTGNKLGEHGAPIKVRIGKEEVFSCCIGCLKQPVNPKHWQTIHANFAKAQQICPVMKKELPKNPKWTIVNGEIVYVCCPPCIKKVEAEPAKYLRDVDVLYAQSLKKQTQTR